jgi:uncharacterized membrane protein
MTLEHPLVARYIERLGEALEGLSPSDRSEVVREIADHITDAAAAGRPLDEVLTALGPADALARAYQVELLLNPKAKASRSDRWMKIAGLVAIGSLPTFIIVVVLGSVGVSLTFAGLAVFLVGVLDSAGALPSWVQSDVQPWIAIALAPWIFAIGVTALWGLVVYVRAMARLVRRLVPRASGAPLAPGQGARYK